MSAPQTIGIIGAAIAGPTLALQILSNKVLRSAFRPVLLDQSAAPESDNERHRAGATVGLFANGLYPLYRLGLRDEIRQKGFECGPLSTWNCDYSGGRELLNTQSSSMWSDELETGVMYFERRDLQSLLLAKVQELGGDVFWGKKAVAFDALEDGRTKVAFKDGQDLTVDILVGADGGYSAVRKFILDQKQPATANERWLPDFTGITGIYGVSEGARHENLGTEFGISHCIWLQRGFLASGPCPRGRTRWDLIYPEDEPPSITESDTYTPEAADPGQAYTEPWVASITPAAYTRESTVNILRGHQDVFHPHSGSLKALLLSADRIIRSPLRQRVWREDELSWGNTVLIGDAGRLMLPTSGQGTGFAVEDATVLASQLLKYALAKTDSRPSDIQGAFVNYSRLRHPRSTKMARMALTAARFGMGEAWYWRALRYYGSKWQPKGRDKRGSKRKDPWPFNGRFDVDEVAQ